MEVAEHCDIRTPGPTRNELCPEPIIYETRLEVLICTCCEYAVPLSSLERHARKNPAHKLHGWVGKAWANKVRSYYADKGCQIQALDSLRLPEHAILKVEHLSAPIACFGCNHCRFYCANLQYMQAHCTQHHAWINTRSPGRQAPRNISINLPWRSNVSCQRVVPSGPASRWFEVLSESQATPVDTKKRNDGESDLVAALADVDAVTAKAEEINQRTIHLPGLTETNSWLKRARWATCLQGCDPLQLLALKSEALLDEDPMLFLLERRFTRIIKIADYICKHETDSNMHRTIATTSSQRPPSNPFSFAVQPETTRKYTTYFCKVLRIIFRTWAALPQHQRRHVCVERSNELAAQVTLRYSMTEKQLDALYKLCSHSVSEWSAFEDDKSLFFSERKALDAIDNDIVEWVLSLFSQLLGSGPDANFKSPIMCALAVLGLQETGGYEEPSTYTSKMSGAVKIIRMTTILAAITKFPADPQFYDDSLTLATITNPNGKVVDSLTFVKQFVGKWLTSDNPHVMEYILLLRSYGMAINRQETRGGNINWVGTTLQYQDIEFSMESLRSMISSLLNEARSVLLDQILFVQENRLPPINWANLRDNEGMSQPGWNFTMDPRNKSQFTVDKWLFNHIYHSKWDEYCMQKAPPFDWRNDRIKVWFTSVSHFLQLLALLIHITGGQPARGPELLSLLHTNSRSGSRRNIFIEDGLICCVTQYSKQYHRIGRQSNIRRYLPKDVGELLLYYIWLVLPMKAYWTRTAFKDEPNCELWSSQRDASGQRFTPERISSALGTYSRAKMGASLRIASYRHIAIAISRKYLPSNATFDAIDDRQEAIQDEQDADMEGVAYGDRVNFEDALNQQAGHSTRTGDAHYGRGIEEGSGSMQSHRNHYREISVRWAKVLGFLPRPITLDRKRPFSDAFEAEDIRLQMERDSLWQTVDIKYILQSIYGPDAQFKSIQEALLQEILRGTPRVLGIMPTGGGKSLMFFLPAKASFANTTIVVTPFIALRMDLRRRAAMAHISCQEWDAQLVPFDAKIVLVTPEAAHTRSFKSFINALKARHMLDRIVLDEVHTYLSSNQDYRSTIADMRHLLVLNTQVLMLTATLPPVRQTELLALFSIDPTDIVVHRAPTVRTNISYSAIPRGRNSNTVKLFREARSRNPGGRALLVAETKRRAEELGAELGVTFYHSGMSSAHKKAVAEAFTLGDSQVLVATNGFGTGIDIPNIRLVFHDASSSTLQDYAQESGRAGRDGFPAEACVLYDVDMSSRISPSKSVELPMQNYLKTKICRRIVIDSYFDGKSDRKQCTLSSGEALCDNCSPKAQIASVDSDAPSWPVVRDASSIRNEIQVRNHIQRQRQLDVQRSANDELLLRGYFEIVERQCAICSLDPAIQKHDVFHATSLCEQDGRVSDLAAKFGNMKFAKYSCCFFCFHPQWICKKYETRASVCKFERTAITKTIFAHVDEAELEVLMKKELSATEYSSNNAKEWMASKVLFQKAPKLEISKMVEVFFNVMKKSTVEWYLQ